MASTFRSPLSDFRAAHSPAAGVKATATTTAPSAQSQPPNPNFVPYLVVTDVTASLVAGTANQTAVAVNLIDGTTGGTAVMWSATMGAPANDGKNVVLSGLNVPCKSGFATLEFTAAGGTLATQSVAMGGYVIGYGGV